MTKGPAARGERCERHVVRVRGIVLLVGLPVHLCAGCLRERLVRAEARAAASQRETCRLVVARGRVAARLACTETELEALGTRLLHAEAELARARAELREREHRDFTRAA